MINNMRLGLSTQAERKYDTSSSEKKNEEQTSQKDFHEIFELMSDDGKTKNQMYKMILIESI